MKYGDSLIIKLNNLPKIFLFYLHFKPDIEHNETKIIEMQNIPTTREQIIKNFNNEGIFLSDICKINIEFEFKLNSYKGDIPNISVDVDESKIKTIKFYKFFFLFDINESIGTAQKSIESFIKAHIGSYDSSVKITKNKLNEVTEDDIICISRFVFLSEQNQPLSISTNILATIKDAKTIISNIFGDEKKLTPNDIVIKFKGIDINDDKKLLLDFENVQFSFFIKPERKSMKIKPKTQLANEDQPKPVKKQQISALKSKKQQVKLQKSGNTQSKSIRKKYCFKINNDDEKHEIVLEKGSNINLSFINSMKLKLK